MAARILRRVRHHSDFRGRDKPRSCDIWAQSGPGNRYTGRMTIADAPTEARPSLRMSEEEYDHWSLANDNTEWVNGEVIFKMSASEDQDELEALMRGVIEHIVKTRQLGIVRGSRFAIRMKLPKKNVRRDPDVLFLSNERVAQRSKTYILGGPDLVVEVVSLDSQFRDYNEKFHEYEEAGVREYWIVNPISQTIDLFVRDAAGKFGSQPASADGRFHSAVIDGLWFHPSDLFADKRPTVFALLKQIDPSLLA